MYKKVTPRHDLSWYIKWFSSITLIIAMMFTAIELFPVNLFIANVGFIGWFVVGMLWHDRASYCIKCNIFCHILYGYFKLLLWIKNN